MFDSWKGFGEDVSNLLIARNVFDAERSFPEMISNKVISNVDVFGSLIFRFVLCDGFGSLIVCVEDRNR